MKGALLLPDSFILCIIASRFINANVKLYAGIIEFLSFFTHPNPLCKQRGGINAKLNLLKQAILIKRKNESSCN
jgi:hypothetical protein